MNRLPIDIQFLIASTIGGIALLNAGILWFMPRLTRHDLYFAVTVPPGFRDEPEGKSILQRYRTELIWHTVLALALFVGAVAWFGISFVSAGPIDRVAGRLYRFLPGQAADVAAIRSRADHDP